LLKNTGFGYTQKAAALHDSHLWQKLLMLNWPYAAIARQ